MWYLYGSLITLICLLIAYVFLGIKSKWTETKGIEDFKAIVFSAVVWPVFVLMYINEIIKNITKDKP